jgi:predicted RNase H-like nuclease
LRRNPTYVAGVDGAPGGWAVVSLDAGRCWVQKVQRLSQIFDRDPHPEIVGVDIPIGLLDRFKAGGRDCDREARKCLGKRAPSVFSAPVRPVLKASNYGQACNFSRQSGVSGDGGAISMQTWFIVRKIKEVDDLLRDRPALREIVREVHPEVCFCELAGAPMNHSKKKTQGRHERLQELRKNFRDMDEIIDRGRHEGLAPEDVLDAAVACWSAHRLATGSGRTLIDPVPRDSTGLPMTIWV